MGTSVSIRCGLRCPWCKRMDECVPHGTNGKGRGSIYACGYCWYRFVPEGEDPKVDTPRRGQIP